MKEISDPRASFITVVRVVMKSDLLTGKICYSVLGSDGDRSKVKHMLEHASGFIQRQIAPALSLRRMPHLTWHYDDTVEQAMDMERLIMEARDKDAKIRGPEAEDSDSADSDE